MQSFSDWAIYSAHGQLAGSNSKPQARNRAILKLLGTVLLHFEIDELSRSTSLQFSRCITLCTVQMPKTVERRPHWLWKSRDKEYAPVSTLRHQIER